MATPATITRIYSVTQSKSNKNFYISAGATVAGEENVLGESVERFALVDIAQKSLKPVIKDLLEEEPIVRDNGNLCYMAKNKDLALEFPVTFKSMQQKAEGEAYWVNL